MRETYAAGEAKVHADNLREIFRDHGQDGFHTLCTALHHAGYALLPVKYLHDGWGEWSGDTDDIAGLVARGQV